MIGEEQNFGICKEATETTALSIKKVVDEGVQVGIVIGGGNLFRGEKTSKDLQIPRAQADYIGMLATLMNGLILKQALDNLGCECRIMSALKCIELAEPVIWNKAIEHLEKHRVIIFSGGTGNPYFTTDTAASLRASEIRADILLKATKVDGVFDKDPKTHSDAKKYTNLTFTEVLEKNLKVMDATAISLCRDNGIPILVFNLFKEDNLLKAVYGENCGTIVQGDG